MKKFNFLIFLSVLIFGLMACTNQKTNVNTISQEANSTVNKDVREKVWEQLKPSQKELIKGTWSDAKVTKITLKSSMGKIEDASYIGKEVYLVDFPRNTKGIQGGFGVYADIKSGKIVGYGYSD